MDEQLVRMSGVQRLFAMGREQVRALDGVDLEIPEGGFAAVLGPSGSGKSTLLHLLGGLDRASEGSIEVAGQRLESMNENALAIYRRTMVGFIFQSFNLLASMTALDNVAFPMQFAGVPREARMQRAWDLLGQVGLRDRAYHRPGELSGGQQQRVAIARALVNNPRLILADEPTGNLDTHSGVQIMQLLAELRGQGRTVVAVSHDPRITQFATETVRLIDGRVVDEAEYRTALEGAASEAGSG